MALTDPLEFFVEFVGKELFSSDSAKYLDLRIHFSTCYQAFDQKYVSKHYIVSFCAFLFCRIDMVVLPCADHPHPLTGASGGLGSSVDHAKGGI